MIEKFTPEELEIIKKELSEMPKNHPKRTVCEEQFKRLQNLFRNRQHYSGIDDSWYQIENDIMTLADKTLCNYDLRPKYRKNRGRYRRCVYVRKEIEEDYSTFCGEIVDVIEKYIKNRIEGEDE